MMSPKKKKVKVSHTVLGKQSSSASKLPDSQEKRLKTNKHQDEQIQARKRQNFITACEEVSCRDYFDHRKRLLLACLPPCNNTICKHDKYGETLKEIPLYAQGSFETEMKSNMWNEALEVCHMSLNSTQYLSSNILKDIVEIMLNAHEDKYSEYTVKHLIYKCQQILMQHFSTHPPCVTKCLRNCYIKFLTSPMVTKEDTFTDRKQYDCNKGIVHYCFSRLEYELSIDSKDGPLVDKNKSIPEEIKHSVRGLHWQKEKCEIYEFLDRPERIVRLFAVLETVVELLQYDLAIWHSRYTNDFGRQIMRCRPLMANILWSDNIVMTGMVTNTCRQIIRIFTYIIHLNYPTSMIKIITLWLNTLVETFYIYEQSSNVDYPNTLGRCNAFAHNFYNNISEMPHDSIIRILEMIEPSFMRHLVGVSLLNKILPTTDSDIINILINFVKDKSWKSYQCDNSEIKLSNNLFHRAKNPKRKINYILKKCLNAAPLNNISKQPYYGKMPEEVQSKINISRSQVLHCLYITLEAYLDAYDVQSVQDTWSRLNKETSNNTMKNECILNMPSTSYKVTENLIKKYRSILQSIKELVKLFADLKKKGEFPEQFNIFGNIGLLEL